MSSLNILELWYSIASCACIASDVARATSSSRATAWPASTSASSAPIVPAAMRESSACSSGLQCCASMASAEGAAAGGTDAERVAMARTASPSLTTSSLASSSAGRGDSNSSRSPMPPPPRRARMPGVIRMVVGPRVRNARPWACTARRPRSICASRRHTAASGGGAGSAAQRWRRVRAPAWYSWRKNTARCWSVTSCRATTDGCLTCCHRCSTRSATAGVVLTPSSRRRA
mmetsp:Transcript_10905/g.36997  ORF Transcript_10905/g.36997 Transcript_10905/m.36997 type:complete len:231 (-) Transcript_10905:337-1029(-)